MAASLWSYLNFSQQSFPGNYFMVGVPSSDCESNLAKSFRRHFVAKSES